MKNENIPFQTIDWSNIPRTEHSGTTGVAYWQTMQFAGLRIRHVEYSKDYEADHWCGKVSTLNRRAACNSEKII